jgi:transcriptional regulator with XRE-family HTH domain
VPTATANEEERPSRAHRRSARFAKEAKALGARIRALRNAEGWTLEEAGERCQIEWKHLQRLEKGALNLTFVTLVRLAVGFGIELEALFIAADPPTPKVERPAKKRGFVITPRP